MLAWTVRRRCLKIYDSLCVKHPLKTVWLSQLDDVYGITFCKLFMRVISVTCGIGAEAFGECPRTVFFFLDFNCIPSSWSVWLKSNCWRVWHSLSMYLRRWTTMFTIQMTSRLDHLENLSAVFMWPLDLSHSLSVGGNKLSRIICGL